MVGREIFPRRFLTMFQREPTTLSDGIGRKPDSGRKNPLKNAVFLAVFVQIESVNDKLET